MLYEKVDKTYLRLYLHKVHNLDSLKRLKFELLESCGLKSYDFNKIKVTSGSKKLSIQEQSILRVERINKQIKQLEAEIQPIKQDLTNQIQRVDENSDDFRHAEILRMLYLEGFTMKDVILNYYTEDTKTTRSNIEGLRKTAEKLLAKISSTPFIKIKQLVIEDWEG